MRSLIRCLTPIILALVCACASPTQTVDPHPAPTDIDHGTDAYQAAAGTSTPAGSGDAVVAAGAAAIDTALGIGRADPQSPSTATLVWGHCRVVNPGERPADCPAISIAFKSSDGAVLAQSRTNMEGRFMFRAEKNKQYLLEVNSAKYIARMKPKGPYSAGTFVWVLLSPRETPQ